MTKLGCILLSSKRIVSEVDYVLEILELYYINN
jgi:hypothetical protein